MKREIKIGFILRKGFILKLLIRFLKGVRDGPQLSYRIFS